MKREVIISYNWNKNDNGEIKPKHQEVLEESAMERILEIMKKGYTSGELYDNVCTDDEDGKDGIEYSGSWDITTKNVDNES